MIPDAGGTPFDDIRRLIAMMPGPDEAAAAAVRAARAQPDEARRQPRPARMARRVARRLAGQGARRRSNGRSSRLRRQAMASRRAASRPIRPRSTGRCSTNFAAGGAAINQICASFDLGFKVFDLALDMPTERHRRGRRHGRAILRRHHGLRHGGGRRRHRPLGGRRDGHRQHHGRGGDLRRPLRRRARGIGSGAAPGVDDAGYAPQGRGGDGARSPATPAISTIRSRCCAGSAAARSRRSPARSSRRGCSASRWCSTAMWRRPPRRCCTRSSPPRIDHCVAGHLSAEGAHQEVLDRLGKIPLLALGMRLGEGSGAALAVGLISAAAACHRGMATFDEARVAGRIDRS